MKQLMAGAGKRQIQIPEAYLPAEDFGQIHDPIHARAVMIEQEEQVMFVSMEITSLQADEIDVIRDMIHAATGVPVGHIWVCATHSFSSPHLMPDDALKTEEFISLKDVYRKALQQAALGAAEDAASALQPAKMQLQKSTCDIVANRDIEFPEGWWVGTNGKGLTDQTVSVVRITDKEDRPIALVTHFAMQSSVLDHSVCADGKKAVSPDVAGLACRKVEETLGEGCIAMYLIGAAGDQAPVEKAVTDVYTDGKLEQIDVHEEGFSICERLSDKLSQAILNASGRAKILPEELPIRVLEETIRVPAKKMGKGLGHLHPTRSYEWNEEGEADTQIQGIRIGALALVGVKPELNCSTATTVLGMSDFDMTLVCTMVNGASKYMADKASYEKVTYEAMNSPFAAGAAEIVEKACIEMLRKLRQ